MSVAADTILILVFLLPGFLFLVSLYAPDHVSRDVTAWQAPSQLAAVVAISIFTHASVMMACLALSKICPQYLSWLANVPTKYVVDVWTIVRGNAPADGNFAGQLEALEIFFSIYVLGTSSVGAFLGYVLGKQIVKGRFRFMVKHAWVYDIIATIEDGFTIAYVLTRIQKDDRVLMYKGVLVDMFVAPDGQISYLLLTQCRRYYTLLQDGFPTTTDKEKWQLIEGSNSQLLIEGNEIANVVFAPESMVSTTTGEKLLDELVTSPKAREKFLREIRQKQKPQSQTNSSDHV